MIPTTVYTATANDIFSTGSGDHMVLAETAAGEIFILDGFAVDDKKRAERMVERVEAHGKINPIFWSFWRAIYGSEAGQIEEAEAFIAAQSIRLGFVSEDFYTGTRIGEMI